MAKDISTMSEGATVGAGAEVHDGLKWHCHTKVEKFHGDSTDPKDLFETVEVEGNALMYGGASAQWQTLFGNGTATAGNALTYFNNANAAIGVGDSSTAEAPTQTDLSAASNKLRKGMDVGFPAHTDGVVASANTATLRATFATTEANYVWAEWGVFNSATAATGRMLNRKVQALGTKASGTTWQVTVTLTLA